MKGKGHGEKQTRKQELAILALLTEKTLKDAAKSAGISEATLWRWMQQPEFDEKYKDAKRQSITQATARLRQTMLTAVDTLEEIAKDKKAQAMARVVACKTILESAMKAHELEDVQERLETLEASLKKEEVS